MTSQDERDDDPKSNKTNTNDRDIALTPTQTKPTSSSSTTTLLSSFLTSFLPLSPMNDKMISATTNSNSNTISNSSKGSNNNDCSSSNSNHPNNDITSSTSLHAPTVTKASSSSSCSDSSIVLPTVMDYVHDQMKLYHDKYADKNDTTMTIPERFQLKQSMMVSSNLNDALVSKMILFSLLSFIHLSDALFLFYMMMILTTISIHS